MGVANNIILDDKWSSQYYPRNVKNFLGKKEVYKLEEQIEVSNKEKLSILITGAEGCGKYTLGEYIRKKYKKRLGYTNLITDRHIGNYINTYTTTIEQMQKQGNSVIFNTSCQETINGVRHLFDIEYNIHYTEETQLQILRTICKKEIVVYEEEQLKTIVSLYRDNIKKQIDILQEISEYHNWFLLGVNIELYLMSRIT
jgi:hypothetical protein